MLCGKIIRMIEDTYPRYFALEWDNVGLLVGSREKEVKKIYVTLDVTEAVIDDAIKQNVDMIVSHHPLIFSPLKKITDEDFIGNRVVKLLQHDISCYAMHTNYDVLRMGKLAAEILELEEIEVLEKTGMGQQGIGCVGKLPEAINLKQCCELVKEKFHLPSVKVFGRLDKRVRWVAISPGSGKGMTEQALKKCVDVLITGDIGHHEGIDAVAQYVTIVDAGHYGLEHIFIDDMAEYLKERTEGVEIVKAPISHPFQIV